VAPLFAASSSAAFSFSSSAADTTYALRNNQKVGQACKVLDASKQKLQTQASCIGEVMDWLHAPWQGSSERPSLSYRKLSGLDLAQKDLRNLEVCFRAKRNDGLLKVHMH
jgi:hypothetical protein